jgi:hypothetical protein
VKITDMDFSIPPRRNSPEVPGDSSDSSSSSSSSEGRPPPAKRPARRPVNTQRVIEQWVIHLELDLGGAQESGAIVRRYMRYCDALDNITEVYEGCNPENVIKYCKSEGKDKSPYWGKI